MLKFKKNYTLKFVKAWTTGATTRTSFEYFESIIHGMTYLDSVLKESIRRYPPVTVMNRVCAKDDYQLGANLRLFKDQLVLINVSGIHLNPEYFPNPFTFDPERFSNENMAKIVPGSYLPFSLGSRNCIAMRFAISELKICLANILRHYKFSITPETPNELTFKRGTNMLIANPFLLKIERRQTL